MPASSQDSSLGRPAGDRLLLGEAGMAMTDLTQLDAFPHDWSVEVLGGPPMIAPARQFTYPVQIAGEEDALARGALHLLVRAGAGSGVFLATCALGFQDPTMPTGVFASPNPGELCAVAGGYAYLIDTLEPSRSTHVAQKPVTAILPLPAYDLLVFSGFHTLTAWGKGGLAWTTERLSWDGIQMGAAADGVLCGSGWNMTSNRDVPFAVDLATGGHTGGAFQRGQDFRLA